MRVKVLLISLAVSALITVPSPAASTPVRAADHTRHSANGLIAFAAAADGRLQLYTVGPDGSRLRQITDQPDVDVINPDWSPNGSRLVFEVSGAEANQLGTVRPDGSDFTLLPIPGPFIGQPSFSHDGKRIFFEQFDGVSLDAIYSARLNGTGLRQITRPPMGYGDTDPNVSPDGRTLSFVRLSPEPSAPAALLVQDLKSGRERQLTSYEANVAIKQDWSPDGRRIAFTRDGYDRPPEVSSNVVTISPTGRHLRNVTGYAGGQLNAFVGSYSPDGRWIVFRQESGSTYTLMKIRPNGSGATPILSVPGLVPRYIAWGGAR